MFPLLQRLREWTGRPSRALVQVPYQVVCNCGRVLTGVRQARHQEIPCPQCQRRVFVLPVSPLPPITDGETAPPLPASPASRGSRLWLLPVVAGSATLLVAILFFVLLLNSIARPPATRALQTSSEGASAAEQLEAGRRALGDGDFLLAREKLDALHRFQEVHPRSLDETAHRELIQLRRQAAVLADAIKEPLEEILRQATLSRPEEWKALFERDYHNKAIIFDAEVRRDPAGRVFLPHYHLFVRREKPDPDRPPAQAEELAQLELGEVRILQHLPLERPHRLWFSARLHKVERGLGGKWTVHLVPDSGVLLTDPGAAAACSLRPLSAEDTEVLDRQGTWLSQLPN